MVLTLRLGVLCGLYGPIKTLTDWSRITEVESVYSAVRTESLYKTVTFRVYSAVRTESLYKTVTFRVYSAVRTESLYKTDTFRVYSAVRTESLYKTDTSLF